MKEVRMNILISNSSEKPIYEQITSQMKQAIITGEIEAGSLLPSMRMLAKELRISVITTKRAYEDLERDGFIYTVIGKGSFVAEKNMEFVREEQLRIVEEFLGKAVNGAKAGGIRLEELQEILKLIFEED
jgi:GntR family transcriptional regulator